MGNEWKLARFKDGVFVGVSPVFLSKPEADNLLEFSKMLDSSFEYKIVHRKKISNLGVNNG